MDNAPVNLDIYMYNHSGTSEEFGQLYELLQKTGKPIKPKGIIFKILDINEKQEILLKEDLFKDMRKHFPGYSYSALINAPPEVDFSETLPEEIIRSIMSIQDWKDLFVSISLDLEPVFHQGMKKVNTILFHQKLIQLINKDLKLPVSVYISPAKLGNEKNGMATNAKEEFRQLMQAVAQNEKNVVLLPAYSYQHPDFFVNEDDILQSVNKIRETIGTKQYKLIVDTKDSEALRNRLQFIKNNNLAGGGLCVFSLEFSPTDGENPKEDTFSIIKQTLPEIDSHLEKEVIWKTFDQNHEVSTDRQVRRHFLLLSPQEGLEILKEAEERGLIDPQIRTTK